MVPNYQDESYGGIEKFYNEDPPISITLSKNPLASIWCLYLNDVKNILYSYMY
jgi:hypothetical protein